MNQMTFRDFFRQGAGHESDPFPYQQRLAEGDAWPARIEVPTGLGKTLAVLLGWLWRRQERHPAQSTTPRRLVYCLPMRVLVEQTRDVVATVLERLGLSAQVRLVVLMGGVDDGVDWRRGNDQETWDIRPERETIIIGTQDMLLSRALNRGYGMSRYRWPVQFALLNTDCLWVIDEVQLVGAGVATTAQLQGLRRKLGTTAATQTSWMSATLEESWLRTVDVEEPDLAGRLTLDESDQEHPVVARRLHARKTAERATSVMGDSQSLASEVIAAHRRGTRTLVMVNTVDRARELQAQIRRMSSSGAKLLLLHSRFRGHERQRIVEEVLAPPSDEGAIIVSTQVVEAGVDLTSATLFTELAPWASLVQRFGRCNRRGEEESARTFWIDLPGDEKLQRKLDKPYKLSLLLDSRKALEQLADVGPAALPRHAMTLDGGAVLRRRDLLDLFDTTPDLMGNDVDVSRFIRDADDLDLRVFWRDIPDEGPAIEASPSREELCSIPIAIAREWQKTKKRMWVWDGLQRSWNPVDRIHPGLTLMLRSEDGGYDPKTGLDPKSKVHVPPVPIPPAGLPDDREYDGDPESEWDRWYTLARHSDDVASEAKAIAESLSLPQAVTDILTTAGRWHDAGKAHPVWQEAARKLGKAPPPEPVAKSQAERQRIRYSRRGFRHELASALLALQQGQSDLVAYLVAAHHGKVRLSLRSLPTESIPRDAENQKNPAIRHARGVWEGDLLPTIELGSGLTVPETRLTLSYMELGNDPVTGRSWMSRALELRDDPALGVFRLAFLEALVRCADERASRRARGTAGVA